MVKRCFLKNSTEKQLEVLVHNPHPRKCSRTGASSYIKQNDLFICFFQIIRRRYKEHFYAQTEKKMATENAIQRT
jgi:hypothetical protein